jgi:hypothetical protein
MQRFECPGCKKPDGASINYDLPFSAIYHDRLVYLAYCDRCGSFLVRIDLVLVGLACIKCGGELVPSTEWDPPHDQVKFPFACPACSTLMSGGFRPTSKSGTRALKKLHSIDRRLMQLRVDARLLGVDPQSGEINRRYLDANQRQVEFHQPRRDQRLNTAQKRIGQDRETILESDR